MRSDNTMKINEDIEDDTNDNHQNENMVNKIQKSCQYGKEILNYNEKIDNDNKWTN
jgi:hypothetical protein